MAVQTANHPWVTTTSMILLEPHSTLLMLRAVLGIHSLTRTSYILRNVKMEGTIGKNRITETRAAIGLASTAIRSTRRSRRQLEFMRRTVLLEEAINGHLMLISKELNTIDGRLKNNRKND
jgi:hypothetical protein